MESFCLGDAVVLQSTVEVAHMTWLCTNPSCLHSPAMLCTAGAAVALCWLLAAPVTK